MTAVLAPPHNGETGVADSEHPAPEPPRVVLRGIRWGTYLSLLEDLKGANSARLTYDRGALEIMSPTKAHESANRVLADLVSAVTEVWGIEVYNLGSTTFKSEEHQRGFEPDTCFYIRNLAVVAEKEEIDLAEDPAPDLVIEIDHTSPSLNKLPLLATLGVPEVWRYAPRRRTLTIFALGEAEYEIVAASVALPLLTATVVEEHMRAFRPGARLSWLEGLREWARGAAAVGQPPTVE